MFKSCFHQCVFYGHFKVLHEKKLKKKRKLKDHEANAQMYGGPERQKRNPFFLLGDQFSYSDLNLSATLQLLKKKVSSS